MTRLKRVPAFSLEPRELTISINVVRTIVQQGELLEVELLSFEVHGAGGFV
jgi:hypothetical protein